MNKIALPYKWNETYVKDCAHRTGADKVELPDQADKQAEWWRLDENIHTATLYCARNAVCQNTNSCMHIQNIILFCIRLLPSTEYKTEFYHSNKLESQYMVGPPLYLSSCLYRQNKKMKERKEKKKKNNNHSNYGLFSVQLLTLKSLCRRPVMDPWLLCLVQCVKMVILQIDFHFQKWMKLRGGKSNEWARSEKWLHWCDQKIPALTVCSDLVIDDTLIFRGLLSGHYSRTLFWHSQPGGPFHTVQHNECSKHDAHAPGLTPHMTHSHRSWKLWTLHPKPG